MLLTGILLLVGVCRKGRCSELPLNYRSTTAQLPLNYRSTTAQLPLDYSATTAQLPLNYCATTARLQRNYRSTTAQLHDCTAQLPLNYRSTTKTRANREVCIDRWAVWKRHKPRVAELAWETDGGVSNRLHREACGLS